MIGGGEAPLQCSSAGCRASASWRVNWRNPRLHSPDRVKVWLACDAHRDHLEGYLASRGLPVVVTALDVEADVVPDPA
jgi:hypothetical protein